MFTLPKAYWIDLVLIGVSTVTSRAAHLLSKVAMMVCCQMVSIYLSIYLYLYPSGIVAEFATGRPIAFRYVTTYRTSTSSTVEHISCDQNLPTCQSASLSDAVSFSLEAGVFIRTTQHAREGLCSEDFRENHSSRMK